MGKTVSFCPSKSIKNGHPVFISGSIPTLSIKDPESGLAAEAVGKTVSFPETPFNAANQEEFRMTTWGL